MNPIYLILIFLATSIIGYLIIKNVPSLLHTPLMAGMNALAGVCLLGAVVAAGLSYQSGGTALIIGQIFGGLGIILATINVVAGFGVTHRMLRMFNPKKATINVVVGFSVTHRMLRMFNPKKGAK